VADRPLTEPGAPDPGPHDEQHELLIAALLDRDVPTQDRADAEQLLTTCPSCAGLHADLLALIVATRELPVLARPRDFRLTAADALRLAPAAAGGEPGRVAARLTGEMQVPNPVHDRHDRLLIASLLDRTPDPSEHARAETLVAECGDCAELYQDLLVLRDAARVLPAPVRPRAFTLSAEDAERQRPSGWRRLVAVFGSSRDMVSRPLAIGLTTIGLAGLLVSSASSLLPTGAPTSLSTVGSAIGAGGAAAAQSLEGSKLAPPASAAPSMARPAAAALPAPAAEPSGQAPELAPSAAPTAESFNTFAGAAPAASARAADVAPEPAASGPRDGRLSADASMDVRTAQPYTRLNVTIVAGLLLIAGLALFGLRRVARRT
jgi:hypothetical protein